MSDVPKIKPLHRRTPDDTVYDDEVLEAVADSQVEADKLNLKATDEILKVEASYNKLRKPHFVKRGELIKKVANFWMTTLMNHPKVSRATDPEDQDCLLSLYHLEVVEADDIKSGYRITFFFDENPYFENKELTKEYFFSTLSKSTTIDWKEGKNLLKQEPTKGGIKKRYFDYKSFFDWFIDDADIVYDEIGMSIRDEIWSNPLQYYLMKDIGAEPEPEEDKKEDDDGK